MKWALWIMLNPSTADAFEDDPTIGNIVLRTTLWAGVGTPQETKKDATISACGRYRYELRRQWPVHGVDVHLRTVTALLGCNGLIASNLYAYRATDPIELLPLTVEEAIGDDTDELLRSQIQEASLVMCAWGNGPWSMRAGLAHRQRVEAVMRMIFEADKTPYMLDRTKAGMPRHPLYWPADAMPLEYRP